MKIIRSVPVALAAIVLTATSAMADKPPPPAPIVPLLMPAPSPGEIVAASPANDWTAISASDVLVMELAPDAKGPKGEIKPRRVVIQLMPAPFSQGWIGNVRKLVAARWYDGVSIVRVQDNYVTQWGDPDGEDAAKAKPLPQGLAIVPQSEYQTSINKILLTDKGHIVGRKDGLPKELLSEIENAAIAPRMTDPYSETLFHFLGWSLAGDFENYWPTHCYGMVGVGRNYPPDTGTGAELYTVIGHAPRHLDRNIALVGRIIEGMEHMSSLPRGTGDLGVYKTPEERTAILSVRLASEMGSDKSLPEYEYLNTESPSFAAYADARANRRDPFFIKPAGGADICNIPVPVRRKKA